MGSTVSGPSRSTIETPATAGGDRVLLSHGGGGRATESLLDGVFSAFAAAAHPRQDASPLGDSGLVVSTDAFVVTPVEFPGGSLGELAVCGTINDVAVAGAVPKWLTAAFILEEGLDMELLRRTVSDMQECAQAAGVEIISGDTKVVGRGSADQLFVVTTGVGERAPGVELGSHLARPGDDILVSGTIGDHGLAVMAARAELPLEPPIESDCAALSGLISDLLEAAGPSLRCLRDPTRGGLAAVANEIAAESGVTICLREKDLPVAPTVRDACALLGLDPLQAANEGKICVVVDPSATEDALAALQAHPLGGGAARVGRVEEGPGGQVWLEGEFGGRRRLELPRGEMLPRIC
ncbi:MAG: hydrogenase expression/formation protein HypE [Armatimonadia bacterium]|nr:hydrogenase expression/formation protein HypE [Armatimonadia bacterium]